MVSVEHGIAQSSGLWIVVSVAILTGVWCSRDRLTPVQIQMLGRTRHHRCRLQLKTTSNSTKACVLHANEQKYRAGFTPAAHHGLRGDSDGTNGALLRGSSRQPISRAPASIVCPQRAWDRV